MTDGQNWGQAPQYPPQGHGQQYPQDQPWRPQQYDPYAHRQRPGYRPSRGPVPPPAVPPQWQQRAPQRCEPPRPRPAPVHRSAPKPPKAAPRRQPGRAKGLVVLGVILAIPAAITWYLVSSGNGSSSAPPISYSPPVGNAGPASAPFSLGPLTLASFPSTTDGRLARGTCEQWAGLRNEYAERASADSPYQLNQWFSGPGWQKEWNDANSLGGDPRYSNIETAFGVGTVGDEASAASAKAMDQACAAGD